MHYACNVTNNHDIITLIVISFPDINTLFPSFYILLNKQYC